MAKTYCINCLNFFDANEPKKSLDGSYGIFDVCKSKDAPITDFVRGRATPLLVNTKGICSYYQPKAILEVEAV